MGRLLAIRRMAGRDLRHRPAEVLLMLVALTAATATLTLGLVLSGATSAPYKVTRNATRGPDVVAMSQTPGLSRTVGELTVLAHVPEVVAHSGPFPVASSVLRIGGHRVPVVAEGRRSGSASVDQPLVTMGSWIRRRGIVLEQSFAEAIRARVGEAVFLNGRPFRVVGFAVTAAVPPYPTTDAGIAFGAGGSGLVWLTRPAARGLATVSSPISYILNLRLAHPGTAGAFVNAHQTQDLFLESWGDLFTLDSRILAIEQRALVLGSWLLGLLAVSSLAVMVGGRIAEQQHRIGLMKAVGGTPSLVAAAILIEYLVLAIAAAGSGLIVGRFTAPLVTSPVRGLLGGSDTTGVTLSTIAIVAAVAAVLVMVGTLAPAVRASRVSTVTALADVSRAPKRRPWMIRVSNRLPTPLLIGLRLGARRPRRMVLSAFSIALAVTTIVTVLSVHAHDIQANQGLASIDNPRQDAVNHVLLVVTIILIILALVNVIFISSATASDTKRPLGVIRALGASPRQVSMGLSAAQALPALPGAVIGIPAGIELYSLVSHGAVLTVPPIWSLVGTALGAMVVIVGLTMIAASIEARQSVCAVLRSDRG